MKAFAIFALLFWGLMFLLMILAELYIGDRPFG